MSEKTPSGPPAELYYVGTAKREMTAPIEKALDRILRDSLTGRSANLRLKIPRGLRVLRYDRGSDHGGDLTPVVLAILHALPTRPVLGFPAYLSGHEDEWVAWKKKADEWDLHARTALERVLLGATPKKEVA